MVTPRPDVARIRRVSVNTNNENFETMLPSLLARDIQQGLQQFLVTGFEPSDDFLHGLMRRFVEDQSGWLKGPYLQVGLPFAAGHSGRKFFSSFDTEFPGFSH
jgi:DEAD/DEAH box helicase domain-containing protein